jgi:hypothetical protein
MTRSLAITAACTQESLDKAAARPAPR